jgi:uncharacterized spore protein YtfJ
MDVDQLITTARDTMTVRRVFGEPIVQDGVTVVPCAIVIGGMGGGGGQHGDQDAGAGGGFGMIALPAGAFRITGERVTWRPAVNANLLVIASTTVVLACLRAMSRRSRATPPIRKG